MIPGPFDRDLTVARLVKERGEALDHLVLHVRQDVTVVGIGRGSDPQVVLEPPRSSESVVFLATQLRTNNRLKITFWSGWKKGIEDSYTPSVRRAALCARGAVPL